MSFGDDTLDPAGSVEAQLRADVARLQQWVNDLQAGMYINCVYCGHRYGPDDQVPATMAEVLTQHIEQCPKHPMSALREQVRVLRAALQRISNQQIDVGTCVREAINALARTAPQT